MITIEIGSSVSKLISTSEDGIINAEVSDGNNNEFNVANQTKTAKSKNVI